MCNNNIYVGKSQGQLFWRKFLAEKFSELTSCFFEKLNSKYKRWCFSEKLNSKYKGCFSEKLNFKYKGVWSRPRQHTDNQYTDCPPTPWLVSIRTIVAKKNHSDRNITVAPLLHYGEIDTLVYLFPDIACQLFLRLNDWHFLLTP